MGSMGPDSAATARRSTVQVAGLPLGGLVEIEVVAFAPTASERSA